MEDGDPAMNGEGQDAGEDVEPEAEQCDVDDDRNDNTRGARESITKADDADAEHEAESHSGEEEENCHDGGEDGEEHFDFFLR